MDQNINKLAAQEDDDNYKLSSGMETYWATKDSEELIRELDNKINDFNTFLLASGRLALMRNSYNQYYAAQYHQGNLMRGGTNGEYRLLGTNHFRNLLENILSQVTQQKPVWQPKAINTDSKTQKQVSVAAGLCDYYMTQQHYDRLTKKATEIALLVGHADVSLEWDSSLGKDVAGDVETGEVLTAGDVVSGVFDPVNSIFDVNYTDIADCPWRIIRKMENKWDLMAKFPQFAQEISNAKLSERVRTMLLDQSKYVKSSINPDVVPVHYFYHRKTAALPDGRMLVWCGNASLTDGPLPYENIPVYRIQASPNINNGFGWTLAFDLLPIQKTYDRVNSISVTNLAYFGLSTIIVPKGGAFNLHPNIGGLNILEVDFAAGLPQSLNFSSTPVEAFKFLELLVQNMQLLSGVNSVNRGIVPPGITSGAGMAMLASQALIFQTPLAHSYADLLQDIGTGLVSIFKLHAKAKRLIEITGAGYKSYLQEFSQTDLTNIFRVQVDLGSALSRTPAGIAQIGETLLNLKQITPADYVNAIQSGNINVAVEKIVKKQLTIRQENEDLMNATPVRALKTDDHKEHVMGHVEVLNDPMSRRQNPEAQAIQEVTLAHVQEHLDLASQLSGIPPDSLLAQWIGLPAPKGGGQPAIGGAGDALAGAMPPPVPTNPEDLPEPAGLPQEPLSGEEFSPTGQPNQPVPGGQ